MSDVKVTDTAVGILAQWSGATRDDVLDLLRVAAVLEEIKDRPKYKRAKREDVTIDDEDFLKELQGMGDEEPTPKTTRRRR
jgi:hypothetical protein